MMILRLFAPFTTASTLALVTAAPALADVTAEDVWANMRAPILAMGGQMEAETTRKDNRLEIGETVIRFALPMGAGEVSMTVNGMNLAENGDGTVALLYPSELYASFRVEGPDGFLASAKMTMDASSYSATASGDAGDVSYAYRLGSASFTLGEVRLPEAPEIKLDMSGTMSGMEGTYRVIEGEILRLTGEGGMGEMVFDMEMVDDLGVATTGRQTMSGGRSGFGMALPTGKLDLMNLAQGLRDGLSIRISGSGSRLESYSTSTLDGALLVVQNYGYLTEEVSYSIDASGLTAIGRNSDVWMEVQFADTLPIPVKATAEAVTGRVAMPLNADEVPADFVLKTAVEGVVPDEALWAMIDPGAQLPREPANITLDLSGRIELLMDLLDINGWMAMGPDAASPVLLHALTLDALNIDLAGVSAQGAGAFTFDNSDHETFDGMPAPEGRLTLDISGANGLIDTLVNMGLLPEEQAMGVRMMMGLFAVPDAGEDMLKSVIEVKPDGQVLANGQRLR